MGVGGVFVAVPAAAAAAGLYFLERYHASSKVVGNELHSSKVNLLAKKMKRDQAKTSEQMPKLAPEFDGLNCFETLAFAY